MADKAEQNITLEGSGAAPWMKTVRMGSTGRSGFVANLEGRNFASEAVARLKDWGSIKALILDRGAYTPVVRNYIRTYGGSAGSTNGDIIPVQIWERDGNGLILVDEFFQPGFTKNPPSGPKFGASGVDPLGDTLPPAAPGGTQDDSM
jgi:hypothetical protein